MNKKVIYYDGKVVVEDEDGEKRPIEYSDNYDDVLVKENVIEVTENIICCLENMSDDMDEKSFNKISSIVPFIVGTFGPTAVLTLDNMLSGRSNLDIIETTLGPMSTNKLIISLTSIFAPISLAMSLSCYKCSINYDKNKIGEQFALQHLREYLETLKSELEVMKKEKTVSTACEGFKVYEVDDEKELDNLYRYRDLYYTLGYNGKKYYRYYERHQCLPKELERSYSEEERQIMFDYLKKEGPTLVKTERK